MKIIEQLRMRKAIWSSAFLFASLLVLAACKKKENDLGLSIQPKNKLIGLNVSDTTQVIMYTVKGDSIRTDEEISNEYNLLGCINDPKFGITKSSIYTHFLPKTNDALTPLKGTDLSQLTPDSINIYLDFQGSYYGQLSAQTFEVYELSEQIRRDSSYYTSSVVSHQQQNLVKLGSGTIIPKGDNRLIFTDGSKTDTVEKPIIKLSLDTSFARKIINQGKSLATNDDFLNAMPGLYITTNHTSQNSNSGALLKINLKSTDSQLILFYQDASTGKDSIIERKFSMDHNNTQEKRLGARFHTVVHKRTPTIKQQLADSTLGQVETYVQSLHGLKTKIELPNIKGYADTSLGIIVNKAELIIPAQQHPYSPFSPITGLSIKYIEQSGSTSEIPGKEFGSAFVGGKFEGKDNTYRFRITSYVNKILEGKLQNNGLEIISSNSAVEANRIVLNGPNSNLKQNAKLRITYTIYQ